MSGTFDYALLTRFNLPSAGAESVVRAREGWLRERVGLFERYCLPSVMGQEDRDFEWIIYFDPESPAWLRDWAQAAEAAGRFRPIYRASVPRPALVSDLRRVTGARRNGVITTNLDNDDALARTFTSRLRRAAQEGIAGAARAAAVYLENGLILGGGVHWRRDRHNAFCSVVESWDDPRTCWLDWHNRLPLHLASRGLRGDPGWLQVVHGSNVSNRVHGRLVSSVPYRDLFPGALDTLPAPSRAALALDAIVAEPARLVRDTVRQGTKSAALSVLGPEGLTRAKGVLAARGLRVGPAAKGGSR